MESESDYEVRIRALEHHLAQLQIILAALDARVVAIEQSLALTWNAGNRG
jgi:uncharacterized coiled-coil protein SlyX